MQIEYTCKSGKVVLFQDSLCRTRLKVECSNGHSDWPIQSINGEFLYNNPGLIPKTLKKLVAKTSQLLELEKLNWANMYITYEGNPNLLLIKIKEAPNLKQLQEMVGGYIQLLRIIFNGKECQMIINEEGKLINLPFNEQATKILQASAPKIGYFPNDYVAGTAVILEGITLD